MSLIDQSCACLLEHLTIKFAQLPALEVQSVAIGADNCSGTSSSTVVNTGVQHNHAISTMSEENRKAYLPSTTSKVLKS
jgi:hypothetical protein